METQIGARNLRNMMDETHGVLILWLLFSHRRDIFVHYQEKLLISGGSLVYRDLFTQYYIIWPRVSNFNPPRRNGQPLERPKSQRRHSA
jgi:hypothetical protein